MIDKEKFFEALKDDNKRSKILRFLKELSANRKIEEFKKMTGFSLDEFCLLLSADKIKIIEIDNKIHYDCRCGTKLIIYKKEKEEKPNIFEMKDPLSVANLSFTECFYCPKCGQRAAIYEEIKKIEVVF
jgi:DNA-binding Lrp family transcriptional regulator